MPAVWQFWVINRPIHRAGAKRALMQLRYAISSDIDIFLNNVTAVTIAPILQRGDNARSHPHIRVEDSITGPRERQYEPLDQFNWKLARMRCLLDMVGFHVRKNPYVARVLAERISGQLPRFWPFEMFLARVFRGHSNWVDVEEVVVTLGEP